MRVLSQYLPASDEELHRWLEHAISNQDAIAFQYVICAAAIAGRKMQASLLPGGACFVADAYRLGWIAWHMEGEVTEELLKAAEDTGLERLQKAMMLFYAAGWWVEFRSGPLPAKLITLARALARTRPVHGNMAVTLAAIVALSPNEDLQDLVPCGRDAFIVNNVPKVRDKFLSVVKEDFAMWVPDKVSHDYTLGRPIRRAVEEIERNDPCPCGSGKKYKRCCLAKGQERLQQSSDVAGKTKVELHDQPDAELTAARLEAMPRHELMRVQDLPEELVERHFLRLAELKCFDHLIGIFQRMGICTEWENAWNQIFFFIVRDWNRKAAARLLKTHPNPKEILAKLEPGVRLLLASEKQKTFLQAIETEALAALQSGDPKQVESVVCAVVASPYPALGILVARSVLPLLKEPKAASALFDQILHARDRLNLPPVDEFSDFMDERALQKKHGEGEKIEEAQAKLRAKAEEVRRLAESLAQAQRAMSLQEKRVKREAAATPAQSAGDEKETRELREKVGRLKAMLREGNEEKVSLRRAAVGLQHDLETLRSAKADDQREVDDDDDAGEKLEISDQQPVRLIEFSKKFDETLASFPKHVARATMHYLGQLAAGEATAFDTVVQLKAYPGVLRKRIAGSHRFLFTLLPDRVRVVDLIARCDLDRRIKKLQTSGLPGPATFS